MNTKLLLVIAAVIAVIITGVSFAVLFSVSADTSNAGKIDKARMAYDHASGFLENGDEEKGVSGLTFVADRYHGSPFAEEALKDLAVFYFRKGDEDKALRYYREVMRDYPSTKDADSIKTKIDKITMQRNLSTEVAGDSVEYTVVSGDSLYRIAKKYNTTIDLIKKMNALEGDMIRVGQKIKVNTAVFSILVDKSKNELMLLKNGKPVKTYVVATGKEGASTPAGEFTITDKVVKPDWTKPDGTVITAGDKDYELGARWIALSARGYGIHGTNDESLIGKNVTAGCIRMYNADVIELYDIVTNGTKVTIIEGADNEPQT